MNKIINTKNKYIRWLNKLSMDEQVNLANKYYKLTSNDLTKTKEMKDNYIKINGKIIKLSEETARSFKEQLGSKLTYENILESRYGSTGYCISIDDGIVNIDISKHTSNPNNINNTRQRALQLQAITKLMIVADYFNKEAEVYANNNNRYYLAYNSIDNKVGVDSMNYTNLGNIYFENKEDAKEAIRILGEDTIKLALTGH